MRGDLLAIRLSHQDRISAYLPLGFPVGIDLFAYTRDEFERLQETSPVRYRAIAAVEEL